MSIGIHNIRIVGSVTVIARHTLEVLYSYASVCKGHILVLTQLFNLVNSPVTIKRMFYYPCSNVTIDTILFRV